MSWFNLKDVKKDENIEGIWLRVESNPEIINEIKKMKLKRFFDIVHRIIIHDSTGLIVNDTVMLEIWCCSFLDTICEKYRYNVFYIHMKYNGEWVCEDDLGKGFYE